MTNNLAQARQIGQDNLTISDMKAGQVLTHSVQGNPITLYTFGDISLPKFVLIGGVHGDEPEGAQVVRDFLKFAEKQEKDFKACVLVIPDYNPDGLKENVRTNGNGVDLNRNFPSGDWSKEAKAPRYYPGPKPESEPETKSLVTLLLETKPFLVVHCHTYIPQICYTGEKSEKWAKILGKNFGHPLTEDIGYPTPGSLGQYCLLNLQTPCVCVELPEQVEASKAWAMVGPAFLEIALRGP